MRVLTVHQGEDSDEETQAYPEQIIRKLREADRLLGEGHEIPEVAKQLKGGLGGDLTGPIRPPQPKSVTPASGLP
jgi:hypothetical protein